MPARSAGLLLYRRPHSLEVLLAHPGGPFFARRDDGVWSVPKGEYGPDEEPLAAARREFAEETGTHLPLDVAYEPLGTVRQRSGKQVTAWAVNADRGVDFDVDELVSNTFELEWPPRSGRRQAFPEIDRASWFDLPTARQKILPGQDEFLDRLVALLA
jgi:predicted NUDIX family NTP pyrophosphohydrolase